MSTIWNLRPKADRRFRSGHPWVYSNELTESPKGVEPGAIVELRDGKGAFLARGYGNPSSLIAFRAVTRDSAELDPTGEAALAAKLELAHALRRATGIEKYSHRLCFGEADFIPGLIIDRYMLDPVGEVFVVQAHAAGADRLLSNLFKVLEMRSPEAGIVLRNDVGVRKLEGLAEEEPRIVRPPKLGKIEGAQILVASASGGESLSFAVDLVSGQKTGFFLDQAANVALAARLLVAGAQASIKVLDLCCYVGQWSAQLAAALKKAGKTAEFTLVDASADALALAKSNVQRQGAQVSVLRGDVMTDLASLDAGAFDIVISDPPALIKGRKNIPAGTHGYLQLHTQALRLVRRGGALVACSCSALLAEEDFLATLTKAAARNQRILRGIARGSQAPDHPMLAEFPEGRYLKSWIGIST